MNRHLRWIVIPSLLLGSSFYSFSEKVSLSDAEALAKEFLKSRSGTTAENVKLVPVAIAGSESDPLYYVFNLADNKGFVMVSGDDTTAPILGYSFKNGYPVKSMPEAMKWMLAGLEREIKAAPSIQQVQTPGDLRKSARKAAERSAETEKLLTTPTWSQEGPFNKMIPGQPLVGCVGTAMSTIMKFYEWPVAGVGSFKDVDFATAYDWKNMRMDNYRSGYTQEEADAVALLMFHASKSIDTQYSMSGSSAYESRVPAALATYFGYDPGVSIKKRSEVATQAEWDKIVKDEIDAGRPVLYCGQDVTAGHAFVCDGYDGGYFHFNWGWGGGADGYFLTTALNPVVSRAHSYNNLNTIVYNIKPADGKVAAWSPIHITNEQQQPGIGSDLTDLTNGKTFKVRVGYLKNRTYNDFKGKIAVALCDADGKMKTLLSSEKDFSMYGMESTIESPARIVTFDGCKLPSGVSVDSSDRIYIVTKGSNDNAWLPVAGELLTANTLDPKTGTPATFRIVLPSNVAGVKIEGDGNVVKGFDYSFKVTLDNPAEDVVTVKANGIILTASANNTYNLNNVCADQEISILVQKAADVVAKRSVWVGTPGTLSSVISEEDAANIKDLTLYGSIDARDFTFMKNAMNLQRLDISGVNISAYGNDQANAIPRDGFRGESSLQEVILPNSVNRFNNACFALTGLKSITIPSGVSKYEYNIFVGCSALRDIWVGREKAEFINWCVLSSVKTDLVTLHVPNDNAVYNYQKAENWNTIKNIVVDPIPAAGNEVRFAVMENNEVNFETEAKVGNVNKGTEVTFKATHIADSDNKMEVYANSTLLTPDANGNYKTTINGNTIIHFDLIAPQPVKEGKLMWSLNDKNGSVGMFTDAVNVIPGQEFTVRLNALDVPQYSDNLYWAIVLTDKDSNIKEFISPVNTWQGGVANNHKYNVTCKVNDSNVREGNLIRLVNSNNKKDWYLVQGANENIVDAIPAVNNQAQMYNMNLHGVTIREEIETEGGQVVNENELDLEGLATITGVESTALRGQDLTLSIVPTSSVYKVDLKVNGEQVATREAAVEYSFVAMKDMDFEINVYNPAVGTTKIIDTYPNGLYYQLGENNVAETVKVRGRAYASDIQDALKYDWAANTIKVLDLSELEIVEWKNNGVVQDAANELKRTWFTAPSVLQQVILPNTITRIGSGVFLNCSNIEEIVLPPGISSVPKSTSDTGYAISGSAFEGTTNLKIIRIPTPPGKDANGQTILAHGKPICYDSYYATYLKEYYNMGVPHSEKVTVIVPEEYLEVYKTPNTDKNYGNIWLLFKYNILSSDPVYGVEFDPTRVRMADETMRPNELASFLGDKVPVQTISAEGKIFPIDNGAKATVYVDGEKVELAEDGSIPVVFHNPKFNADKAGNHRIDVEYTLDLNFHALSDAFAISEPEVTDLNEAAPSFVLLSETEEGNENGNEAENGEENNTPEAPKGTHTWDTADALKPVLRDVKENSKVRFKVDFSIEESKGVLPKVMVGNDEITADADGYYELNLVGENKTVEIFAVPTEGAIINAEDLASIKPEEAAGITSISLEGEMTEEQLQEVVAEFSNLESLDLSNFDSELPEAAFSGMENLTTVVLPEVSEIPAGTFSGCSSLQSVDIPATVGAVGAGAFKDCGSLEKITFTGVSSIGDGAFDGCDNLTTITLLSSSADPKSDVRHKSRKKAGELSSNAFKGLNPNCIVVLDDGVSVPSSKANYLLVKEESDAEGTRSRVYSAESDISFVEGYPLSIPYSFTLKDDAVVTFAAETKEWTPVLVPFNVNSITDESNQEIVMTLAEEDAETIDNNTIYGLAEGGEKFQSVERIEANKPYFIYSVNDGKTIFSSKDVTVPATPAEIRIEGKDFTLHASYKLQNLPATDLYLLDANSYAFIPAEVETSEGMEDPTVEVKPFEFYATSSSNPLEILTGLPGVKSPLETGVEAVEVKEFKVTKEGGVMVVYSPDSRTETLYTADGKVVRVIKLKPGRNVIDVPATGVYVLSNSKVIL
ncbi:MAG: C10 family peptidase [Muribaculaceae bacterium]|nr:C10 family peptidase [Muribaculaceae bacterium]